MDTVQIFNYNENPVSFRMENGEIMINATAMAKPFGKRPGDYLRLPSTNELITAIVRKSHKSENQVVSTVKGSMENGGGTWMHEDLAIDFAQWLSIDFRLWCNQKLKELLKFHITATDEMLAKAATDPHFVLAMMAQIKDGYLENRRLESENKELEHCLSGQVHKVEFYDKIAGIKERLNKDKTYTVSQIARILNMQGADLNLILEKMGIQEKRGGLWTLVGEYKKTGYLKTKTCKERGYFESNRLMYYTTWTYEGAMFILSLFEEGPLEMLIR